MNSISISDETGFRLCRKIFHKSGNLFFCQVHFLKTPEILIHRATRIDEQALVLVPPTRQPAAVRTAIAALSTGGRTPLLQGLRSAGQLLIRERARHRVDETLLVVVTDGRYRDDLRTAGTVLRDQVAPALVIDTEDGPVRLGRARTLAAMLGAEYTVAP